MEKRLLILGSVEDFTDLTRYAAERGIYTVVVDAYQGEAKRYASKSYTMDLNDDKLIDQICKYERIDHILSSFSDNLFEKMVYASDRNNLPCFCSKEKVRYLRDKVLMKKMCNDLGIRTARGMVIESGNKLNSFTDFDFPCVIKPLDGWGSKGMKIVNNISEAEDFAPTSIGFSTSRKAMIEEINHGFEINVMSWIRNGKVYLMEFGDRETSGATSGKLPYISREVFPSFFYEEAKDEIMDYFHKIAGYVGIKEGPLSMQVFYRNGEITIGEVAGRFFGLGQGIVPVINGIDLNKLLVNSIYFSEENEEITGKALTDSDHCSIALYLKAKEGIVRDLGNIFQFADEKDEHVDEFRIFAKQNESTAHIPWIARIYAHFATRGEADEYTRKIYDNLYVPGLDGDNLVASNKITDYLQRIK